MMHVCRLRAEERSLMKSTTTPVCEQAVERGDLARLLVERANANWSGNRLL